MPPGLRLLLALRRGGGGEGRRPWQERPPGAGTKGGRAAGHVGPYRGLHSQGRPGRKRSPPPSCRLATRAGRAWLAGQGGGEAPAPQGLQGAGHLACGGLGCEPRAPMTSPRCLLPRRPPSARRVGKLRLGHSAGPAGAPELCSRGWGGQCREVADLAHPRGPREHAGGVGGDRAGPDRGVTQSRPPHPAFYVTYDACASVNDHEEGAGRGPTSVVGWGAGGSHPEGPPTGLGSAHRPQAVVSICGASGSRSVRRARVTHGQPRLPGRGLVWKGPQVLTTSHPITRCWPGHPISQTKRWGAEKGCGPQSWHWGHRSIL